MYNNSIYTALKNAAGKDERKLGIAYVHSMIKSRSKRIASEDPLADEGMNIYVELDRIGRDTLQNSEESYIEIIDSNLNNKREPAEGSVEETVLRIFSRYDFEESLDKIGSALKGLLTQKHNHKKPLEEITAGYIQRHEQKAIRDSLSEYL